MGVLLRVKDMFSNNSIKVNWFNLNNSVLFLYYKNSVNKVKGNMFWDYNFVISLYIIERIKINVSISGGYKIDKKYKKILKLFVISIHLISII